VVNDTQCGGNPVPTPYGVRAEILRDVLTSCGVATGTPVIEVPDAAVFSVSSYPNPFNPRVRIDYQLPTAGRLVMSIYNLKGERVKVLRDEPVAAGPGHVLWDGTDGAGALVASGVYFCRTRAAGKEDVQKLMLVR
jgi:hypothetical protein